MADYFQVKNQNIFNPPANTSLGNATNQFNDVYVENDLVLGNVTVTGATIIAPRVTTIAYPGDDTAADTAGGQTITITGTGFVAGASVLINGSAVGVVSVVSSTTITIVSPANTTGSYVIYVINPDGSTAIAIPGIQYSGTPTWTTAAGTLGNVYETASFTQTVTATGDAPITYSVTTGSIPPGSTFNANGTITGTSQLSASPTTYSFTVRATDAQLQDTDRAFSISVIPDVVTWSNPTDNATYSPAANIAIANITLSATSAVGSGITYSANTLPTGLSLTGANISGTPTVVANTSSLLTATANTTSESSSITINWSVSVASDPYFMYNSLLLPGTGSNGAQNNTFLDGSTNNFAITRNGNTTQGTFSPYGPNWSNYLAGAGNYFQTPASSASTIVGTLSNTANLTIECWIYPTAYNSSANFPGLIGDMAATIENNNWSWGITNTGTLMIYWNVSGTQLRANSTNTVSLNTWTHIALNVAAGAITMYINGTSQGLSGTTTLSTPSTSNGYLVIGQWNNGSGGTGGTSNGLYTGYISNLRVVKASTYTSSFTPSTTPLTAITSTSLLYCQSNRFKDNSTNNLAITLGGVPTIQRFSPFSPTAAYSAGTIGGSGYFDGNGDYLSLASNTAFDMGTGNFTLECYYYHVSGSSATYPSIFSSTDWVTGGVGLRYNNLGSNKFQFFWNSVGDPWLSASATSNPFQWNHVALTRSGNNFTLWVNGQSAATGTNAGAINFNYNTGGPRIGWGPWDGSNGYLKGIISNFRLVKGTAVYTSAFTPPTAPVTAISGTSLLCDFTNAGIIDNTMMNNLETVGNAQISTAQTKFGGGSMYFDGTGDYLLSNAPSTQLYSYGGDFTIELWLYRNANGQTVLVDSRPTGGGGASAYYVLYINTSNVASWIVGGTVRITGTTSISNSTWYHIAVSRSGSSTALFVNGTQNGSIYTDSTALICATSRPYIGIDANDGSWALNGYIDDLRITKGYARYTTAIATTSNTTASSIRSGSSLAGFFGSYGVFNTTAAGQYLLVDFGVSVSNIQTTYLNYNGGQWAPTSVLIQTSNDNSTWSTVVTYSDNNTNTLQTIASTGSGRYWRIYQNSATRQNSAGYEWHLGSFTMTNSFTPPTAALPTY
jgi:hypothetical protein